jgi:hypothetical protein
MNAAIPNGQSGIALESTRGHGLCGDRGDRRAFMKGGPYGPTSFRSGSYQSGGLLPVQISVKAYHAGWFEFRLCDISTTADGEVTQECLNEHVLKVDSSTPFYPTILDYANMKGRNPNGDGGVYKCKNSGGYADPTATVCKVPKSINCIFTPLFLTFLIHQQTPQSRVSLFISHFSFYFMNEPQSYVMPSFVTIIR